MRTRFLLVLALLASALAFSPPAAGAAPDVSHLRLPGAAAVDGHEYGAFLHFTPLVPFDVAAERVARVHPHALELGAAHAVWVTGGEDLLRRLVRLPGVAYAEPAQLVRAAGETATWATGARAVYEPTGGRDLRIPLPDGTPVDGRGIGIAVVDSGIDGNHPDLPYGGTDPKVVRNFLVDATMRPPLFAEMADTDTGGHGTHVAGIAAGSGAASGGRYRGVAPAAKLYGFSVLRVDVGLNTDIAAALQWIYDHGHEMQPPIRVVNLSLGSSGPYNPNEAVNEIVDALVADRGVTAVFAAMNNGGDGTTDNTNNLGKNPTPGVVMVANYDDERAAATDGELAESSSRGLASDPGTWPDVSAPGTFIGASCAPQHPICSGWHDAAQPAHYSHLSGTSMASPHVAGVAALLYQAQPDITPAEVERLLERTARKITFGASYEPDPSHPGETSSYDKGHGLLEAYSAVRSLVPQTAPTPRGSSATVLATDAEDPNLPGALDVLRLQLSEVDADTLELRLRVRDLDDSRGLAVEYAVDTAIGGRRHDLRVALDGTASTRPTVDALSVQRDGDELVARYDRSALGATPGAAMLDASLSSQLLKVLVTDPEFYEENVDSAPVGRTAAAGAGAASEEHVFN